MDILDFARFNRYRAIDTDGNWKHGNDFVATSDGAEIIDDSYSDDTLRRTPINVDTLCVGYAKQDSRGTYIFNGDLVETAIGIGSVKLSQGQWIIVTAAGRIPLDGCHSSITVVGNRWDTPDLFMEWLSKFPDTEEDL